PVAGLRSVSMGPGWILLTVMPRDGDSNPRGLGSQRSAVSARGFSAVDRQDMSGDEGCIVRSQEQDCARDLLWSGGVTERHPRRQRGLVLRASRKAIEHSGVGWPWRHGIDAHAE